MDTSNKLNKDSGEASSDGEEDFESADEGDGKEKGNTLSGSAVQTTDSIETQKVNESDADSSRKSETDRNVFDTNAHKNMDQSDTLIKEGCLGVSDDNETSPNKNNANLSSVSLEENRDICADKSKLKEMDDAKECQTDTTSMETGEDLKRQSPERESGDKSTVNNMSNVAEGGTSSGWGWGAWGTVFNQATASVTSSLSHVIEKVESTLGIPEPGELEEVVPKDEKEVIITEPRSIQIERAEKDSVEGSSKDSEADVEVEFESFLSSWGFSSLSNAVQTKGLELVTEGIDALEMIGKKTMNVITEGDPGLRSKRNMFQKPTLSQVLREAKENSTKEATERKKREVLEKVNFNDEFDRCQGLAHLEALEILSRECEGKVESMLIDMFEDDLENLKTKLRDIENVFVKDSQSEDDVGEKEDIEFAEEIGKCAMALNLAFVPDKLNQREQAISEWLEECVKEQKVMGSSRTLDDIYSHAIASLANITARSIEVFRKVAEMILLAKPEEETVTAQDRAIHLHRLTKVVTSRISSFSANYARCLNTAVDDPKDNDSVTPVITEVYLECSNSSSHIQDAFNLLVPVLQVSELNNFKKELK